MQYIHLAKLYYQNEAEWQKIYQQRFSADTTRHFPLSLKQYGYKNSHPVFFCYNEELTNSLQRISELTLKLLLLKKSLPESALEQFILDTITEEIKSTNDIEGVRSTRKEIRELLSKLVDGKKSPRLASVVEQYALLSEGAAISFATCSNIREFYNNFLWEEIISDNPDNLPDGKLFRKGPVDIASSIIGKVVHQGLYPEAEIISAMEKALAILHDDNIPVLIRNAIFHYLFAYIHPFYDGNGRMARFISSYFLAQSIDVTAALRLSVSIKKQKSRYYKLMAETDSDCNLGDLTPFVIYFLQLVEQSLRETISTLEENQSTMQNYVHIFRKLELSPKQQQLYCFLLEASLFYGLGLTIQQLQGLTECSRVTVQKQLDMISPEYLIIDQSRKPYRYKLDLEILSNT